MWDTGAGAAARLNWSAVAECESGGNPRAVNPAGYYGLYQFNRQSWATVGGSGLPSDAPAAEVEPEAVTEPQAVAEAVAEPTPGEDEETGDE